MTASRTKLMVSSKLKGAPGKPHTYPQPEGLLGEAMCKYGKDLNEDSNFGKQFSGSINLSIYMSGVYWTAVFGLFFNILFFSLFSPFSFCC